MEIIQLTGDELAELIRFSADSGETITGTIPCGGLVVSKTGEKTLRKLAEMRGIHVCRTCPKPIESGELCDDCAKGNDPFFTCDNAGKDLR